MSPLACGLVNMELHRGDGSLGTFLGVQAGLAMKAIAMLGSEEQKERWLPAMARLEKIGAFALTEPAHASDSVALETVARRDGDAFVIDGSKRWIGNGTIADVVIVWARSAEDGQVKGFLVETDAPGYSASVIEGKGCARGVAGGHLPGGCPGSAGEPPARREYVQGHRLRARHNARRVRVGSARSRGRRIRHRAFYATQRQQFGRPSSTTPGRRGR
jgi:glutaryl-CoA dehydrogenase